MSAADDREGVAAGIAIYVASHPGFGSMTPSEAAAEAINVVLADKGAARHLLRELSAKHGPQAVAELLGWPEVDMAVLARVIIDDQHMFAAPRGGQNHG